MRNFRKNTKLILSALLILSIFVMSSKPIPQMENEWHNYDKLLHFIVFALLALLITGAIEEIRPKSSLFYRCLLAVSLSTIWGAIIEINQYFIPLRQCSMLDLFADVFGIFSVISIYYFLKKRQLKSEG